MTVRRCILLLLIVAAFAFAQDFRATLSGVVTDPSGAAIPGATVKATNTSTNAVKEAQTTAVGNYTIPYLDPGVYNVEVSAAGFQTIIREKIVLRVADKVNLPLEMKIGQTTETLVVTAEQDVIETASADRGLVFDPIKTQQLPLNGRQTYMLMSLTPGVLFTQEAFGPSGFSGTRGWDVNSSYRINGARSGQNLFLLNGAPISDPGGSWQVAPNVEAVQEFKVMTNTYDASYGRFGGGVVNTTIKSGANAWHGNVFDYFRNAVLDANRTENKQVKKPRPAHNQHQFGGVLGGAIRKDKDFIFGSFEGWREVQPASVISSVPHPALRDGDFSDYASATGQRYTIYDPLTSRPCVAATDGNCRNSPYIRQAFSGNAIPASRISPVGAKVMQYFPLPNGPDPLALSSNFYTNTNGRYRYDQPMGRWDHNFSERDKLYVLVTYQHGKEYRNSTGFLPPAGSGDINSQRTDQNYVAAWTRVLSPTSVLDIRGSIGRFTSMFPRYTDYDFTVDKLGMTKMPHAPTNPQATVPRFDVSGSTQLFALSSAGEWNTQNQWNFTPSLSMVRGSHTIKTGFEFNYWAQGVGNRSWANGNFTFNQEWTRQLSNYNAGTYGGASVASLLLGVPDEGQVDWAVNPYRSRPYFGVYIQDDWKITRKLTLNLGLRYDVQYNYLERFNRYNSTFDMTTKNPMSDEVLANWAAIKQQQDAKNPKYPYPAPPSQLSGGWLFAGVGGQSRRIFDTDWTNLGPRVGVAWQVLPKTVVRMGGGIYYQSPTQTGRTEGFSMTTDYESSLDGMLPSSGSNVTGAYSLVDPFPTGILQPTGAGEGLLTRIGRSVTYDPRSMRIPRTYQYSFGIQQQLPGNIVAEASYAGNYQIYATVDWGRNQISMADYNQSRVDAKDYNNLQVPNPFYNILPKNGGVGQNPTIPRGDLLRPNPLWGGITQANTQWGRYRSDALQLKVEKRVLGGRETGVMTWVLSYTLQKAFEQNHRLQSWNLEEPLIYELDNQDKPNMLAFSGVWDLPFGRSGVLNSDIPVVKKLIGGWQFDWILTYNSGYPVNWPNLVNYCGEWHAKPQTRYSWFNNDKDCYDPLEPFNLRTIPDRFPNIRQHQAPQLNVAFEKTTHVGERYRFLIRAEAFNLTNTSIYGAPNTDFNSTRFGRLNENQINWPRLVQFAAKFFF